MPAWPQGEEDERLAREELLLAQELGSAGMDLPRRKDAVGLGNASHVLSAPLRCYPNAPLEFHAFQVSARRLPSLSHRAWRTLLSAEPLPEATVPT